MTIRETLYQAAASPHGIAVETTDPNGLRQCFYQEVRRAKDPLLKRLSFQSSPVNPETEIWIVRHAEEKRDPPP